MMIIYLFLKSIKVLSHLSLHFFNHVFHLFLLFFELSLCLCSCSSLLTVNFICLFCLAPSSCSFLFLLLRTIRWIRLITFVFVVTTTSVFFIRTFSSSFFVKILLSLNLHVLCSSSCFFNTINTLNKSFNKFFINFLFHEWLHHRQVSLIHQTSLELVIHSRQFIINFVSEHLHVIIQSLNTFLKLHHVNFIEQPRIQIFSLKPFLNLGLNSFLEDLELSRDPFLHLTF